MTIQPAVCPECGGIVHGTCETLPGTAVQAHDDGSFSYTGWTDVCWDGHRTEYEGKRARVCCERGHEWLAVVDDPE